jgi:hypothetical protein
MIVPGLILALVSGLLFAFGLHAVGAGRRFAETGRLVVCAALAFTAWEYLGSPIFNHYGWGYWIYYFVAEAVAWIAAGMTIAWFLPRPHADAPLRDQPAADALAAE